MPFYMQGTGHWLGLDVHDAGRYTGDDGKPRKLEKGMVITVEPGLYFAHDNALVPKKYRGIGIRIEDDVVITDGEPLVLTHEEKKKIKKRKAQDSWAFLRSIVHRDVRHPLMDVPNVRFYLRVSLSINECAERVGAILG